MLRWVLTMLLMMPLCGSGEFDRVSFPVLYADAQMPLYACEFPIKNEKDQSIILILAGEPREREGGYKQLDLVDVMTWPEFLEELDREVE